MSKGAVGHEKLTVTTVTTGNKVRAVKWGVTSNSHRDIKVFPDVPSSGMGLHNKGAGQNISSVLSRMYPTVTGLPKVTNKSFPSSARMLPVATSLPNNHTVNNLSSTSSPTIAQVKKPVTLLTRIKQKQKELAKAESTCNSNNPLTYFSQDKMLVQWVTNTPQPSPAALPYIIRREVHNFMNV